MQFASGEVRPVETFAVRIWNMMGGQLDWQALPILCEICGIVDVEILLTELYAIRAHLALQAQHGK